MKGFECLFLFCLLIYPPLLPPINMIFNRVLRGSQATFWSVSWSVGRCGVDGHLNYLLKKDNCLSVCCLSANACVFGLMTLFFTVDYTYMYTFSCRERKFDLKTHHNYTTETTYYGCCICSVKIYLAMRPN